MLIFNVVSKNQFIYLDIYQSPEYLLIENLWTVLDIIFNPDRFVKMFCRVKSENGICVNVVHVCIVHAFLGTTQASLVLTMVVFRQLSVFRLYGNLTISF